MMISPYNPYDRYRRRASSRLAGVLGVFIFMGLSCAFGYWLGGQTTANRAVYLQSQLEEQLKIGEQLQSHVTELSAEAQTANTRYEQLQATVAETIPEGPMQDLITILRKQLDEGMDPQRLEFVIRSARPPRNCTEPETKRFVISTPANTGPDSQIEIADGAIVIKGTGISAANSKGQKEAWYDSSKAVTIEFIVEPGTESARTDKKVKTMPLHHSVVLGNREYRFTVEEGAQSFARVTFDSCDYP